MTLSSPSIEAQVATSPRHYASAFRSQEQRFKGLPAEKIQVTNLEYDIDLFDTTAGVQRSHRNFAATFRPPTKSEEIDSNWKIPKVTDPSYNVDCGTKTGVFNGIQVREGFHGPGRKYGFNLKAPRFTSQRKCGPETEVYDVDALNKSTLVTTCQKSPLRYSGMTAVTPRSEVQSKAACADYNPDVFNIARRVKESGFKVSTMTSLTPRPATERVVNGGEYDTDALNKTTCFKNSLLLPGARSSFVATPRRPPGVRTDGADKMYDADYGPAQSVWTKVRTSPRIYANMRYSSRRDEERPPLGLQLEYQADCPAQPSVATEVLCTPRLYTNVRTHTPRFVDLVLPPQLGAIYDHESAPRGEGSIAKRVSESQRKYFGVQSFATRSLEDTNRPALHLQYDVDYGPCETLATGMCRSGRSYTNMHSKVPRFRVDRKEAPMDEYEALVANPDKIDLKFQIRGNLVVKQTNDRALLVVGRQGVPQT